MLGVTLGKYVEITFYKKYKSCKTTLATFRTLSCIEQMRQLECIKTKSRGTSTPQYIGSVRIKTEPAGQFIYCIVCGYIFV